MEPVPDPTRETVLVVPPDGERIGRSQVGALIGDAWAADAETVAVPVARLDPGFFDLRTGVAGEIVQAFAIYRIRLIVVGRLPDVALASTAFTAFVREANRGTELAFVDSLDAAARRRHRGPCRSSVRPSLPTAAAAVLPG